MDIFCSKPINGVSTRTKIKNPKCSENLKVAEKSNPIINVNIKFLLKLKILLEYAVESYEPIIPDNVMTRFLSLANAYPNPM